MIYRCNIRIHKQSSNMHLEIRSASYAKFTSVNLRVKTQRKECSNERSPSSFDLAQTLPALIEVMQMREKLSLNSTH